MVFDRDYVIHGDVADVVVAVEDGRLARWTDTTAEPVTPWIPPGGWPAQARPTSEHRTDPGLVDTAAVLLAAEQIGAAARCLELTVEYTKTRVQFGRPIGSFQALKHRMADMYVAVQSARAVVAEAVADPGPVCRRTGPAGRQEAFYAVAGEASPVARGYRDHLGTRHPAVLQAGAHQRPAAGPARAVAARLEGELL